MSIQPTHVATDVTCPGCGQSFTGQRGLRSHQSRRFQAMACRPQPTRQPDRHGNVLAEEGCTICTCGCKYWEKDVCVDCGDPVQVVLAQTETS